MYPRSRYNCMPTCEICNHEVKTERGLKAHKTQKHSDHSGKYTHECQWCGDEFESNRSSDSKHAPKYCPSTDDDKGCYAKSLEGDNNPNKNPERKKKISETMKKRHEEGMGYNGEKRDSAWMIENVINKRDDSYLHDEPSEETKEKLSKAQKRLVEKGEHHLQDPEMRKKIVKTRDENGTWDWYPNISPKEAQKRATEARDVFGPKIVDVKETGNTVDSTWEAEVDRLLHSLDLNYYYNDGDKTKKYQMKDGNYVPDFMIPGITQDTVIEVKGWLGYGYNKEKTESFAKEMTDRDDVRYIIYGDVELEADEYVDYGNEEELASLLK